MLSTSNQLQQAFRRELHWKRERGKTRSFECKSRHHHFSQSIRKMSLQIANCVFQILRVFGFLMTTTKLGSGPASSRLGKTMSPTRRLIASEGRKRHSKANQEIRDIAHHLRLRCPDCFNPRQKPPKMTASKASLVMGTRGCEGKDILHPLMAAQVPRKRLPDMCKRRWAAIMAITTLCNRSPSSKASCTHFPSSLSTFLGSSKAWRDTRLFRALSKIQSQPRRRSRR